MNVDNFSIFNREMDVQMEFTNWLVNLETQTLTETENLVHQFLNEIRPDELSEDIVTRLEGIIRNV